MTEYVKHILRKYSHHGDTVPGLRLRLEGGGKALEWASHLLSLLRLDYLIVLVPCHVSWECNNKSEPLPDA